MASKSAFQRGPGFSSRMPNIVNERAELAGGDAVPLRLLRLSQAGHDSGVPRRRATVVSDSTAAVTAAGSTARAGLVGEVGEEAAEVDVARHRVACGGVRVGGFGEGGCHDVKVALTHQPRQGNLDVTPLT